VPEQAAPGQGPAFVQGDLCERLVLVVSRLCCGAGSCAVAVEEVEDDVARIRESGCSAGPTNQPAGARGRSWVS